MQFAWINNSSIYCFSTHQILKVKEFNIVDTLNLLKEKSNYNPIILNKIALILLTSRKDQIKDFMQFISNSSFLILRQVKEFLLNSAGQYWLNNIQKDQIIQLMDHWLKEDQDYIIKFINQINQEYKQQNYINNQNQIEQGSQLKEQNIKQLDTNIIKSKYNEDLSVIQQDIYCNNKYFDNEIQDIIQQELDIININNNQFNEENQEKQLQNQENQIINNDKSKILINNDNSSIQKENQSQMQMTQNHQYVNSIDDENMFNLFDYDYSIIDQQFLSQNDIDLLFNNQNCNNNEIFSTIPQQIQKQNEIDDIFSHSSNDLEIDEEQTKKYYIQEYIKFYLSNYNENLPEHIYPNLEYMTDTNKMGDKLIYYIKQDSLDSDISILLKEEKQITKQLQEYVITLFNILKFTMNYKYLINIQLIFNQRTSDYLGKVFINLVGNSNNLDTKREFTNKNKDYINVITRLVAMKDVINLAYPNGENQETIHDISFIILKKLFRGRSILLRIENLIQKRKQQKTIEQEKNIKDHQTTKQKKEMQLKEKQQQQIEEIKIQKVNTELVNLKIDSEINKKQSQEKLSTTIKKHNQQQLQKDNIQKIKGNSFQNKKNYNNQKKQKKYFQNQNQISKNTKYDNHKINQSTKEYQQQFINQINKNKQQIITNKQQQKEQFIFDKRYQLENINKFPQFQQIKQRNQYENKQFIKQNRYSQDYFNENQEQFNKQQFYQQGFVTKNQNQRIGFYFPQNINNNIITTQQFIKPQYHPNSFLQNINYF